MIPGVLDSGDILNIPVRFGDILEEFGAGYPALGGRLRIVLIPCNILEIPYSLRQGARIPFLPKNRCILVRFLTNRLQTG